MNWLVKLFTLCFDEPENKSVSEADFLKMSDAEQDAHFEKSVEQHQKAAETPKEEVVEDEDTEEEVTEDETEDEEEEVVVDEETTENEVEETDEEPEESEEEEDAEDPVANSKRFKDTQAAFRKERQARLDAEKRIAALEAKVNTPEKEKEKEQEITIDNIPAEVLQKALRERPVETMRWLADQQTKKSLAARDQATAESAKTAEKQERINKSEEAATTKFPILGKLIDMDDTELKDLKAKNPTQYTFAMKTVKYLKEFQARGDEEALYNAANRAYVELSPKMIKDIQIQTKLQAKKEFNAKKRILGKVSTTASKGSKSAGLKRSLSEDEFNALNPAQQDKFFQDSINRKRGIR